METILSQLTTFIQSKTRILPQWLYGDNLQVYVRKAFRRIPFADKQDYYFTDPCTIGWMLDIAAISVEPPHWNNGICQRFIAAAHELHPWKATYIENAMSDTMIHIANKLEFVRYPDSEPPCFIKLKYRNDNAY